MPIGVLAFFSKYIISPHDDALLEGLANTTAQVIQAAMAEDALRESEKKYSTLVENSLTGIYIDQDGKIVFANSRFAEIYRYPRQELLGMESWKLVHPEDRALTDEIREKRLRGEAAPRDYEARGLRKDGATIWIKRRNTQIEYRGQPAILGNVVDITERKRAEDALRQSEANYRLLFSAESDAIIVADADTKEIVDANEAALALYGYGQEQLLGLRAIELSAEPEESARHIEQVSSGEPFVVSPGPVQRLHKKKDSTIFPVEISSGFYTLRGRKMVCAVIRDITERKRAEAAVRESEERYHTIFELAADSIVLIDGKTGELVEFNKSAHESLGFTHEEFKKLKIPDFEVIESADEVAKHIKKIIKEGSDSFETKHRTKSGEIRDVEVRSRPLSIRGKNFVQSIWQDITDRNRAEAAVRESEQRYRAVLEASPDPIVIYDMEGKCSYINPAFTTVFGWTLEELIGKKLDYVPEENWPETQLIIDTVLAGQSFSGVESRRYTKDGNILDVSISAAIHLSRDGVSVDVSISAAIHLSRDGVSVGSVHFLRDITQRKRAEKTLQRRKEELQAHTRSLEEVNTALKVLLRRRKEDKSELEEKVLANVKELVLPYLETLRNTRLDAKQMAYISIIESHVNEIVSPFLRS
jgi:PAS domain S-box-containing protein